MEDGLSKSDLVSTETCSSASNTVESLLDWLFGWMFDSRVLTRQTGNRRATTRQNWDDLRCAHELVKSWCSHVAAFVVGKNSENNPACFHFHCCDCLLDLIPSTYLFSAFVSIAISGIYEPQRYITEVTLLLGVP